MSPSDQKRADAVIKCYNDAAKAKKKFLAAIAKSAKSGSKTPAFTESTMVAEAPAANSPPVEEIIPQVVSVIFEAAKAFNAPLPKLRQLANGNFELDLEADLRITSVGRENLSPQYTAISARYPNGRTVGKIESRKATTVSKAITRVHLRANGQS